MTPHCLTTRFTYFPLMLLALFALVLQGCGDGVRVLPPSDADPTGYYTNSGTASVSDGAGGTIDIGDLQAMVQGNRIMMMSVAEKLLYDGTITNISGNDFTADFTIYSRGGDVNGATPMTTTANGTITAGSSITGTLTGSGVGSGPFNLTYALTDNQAADIARIENVVGVNATWGGNIGGGVSAFPYEFILDNVGAITHDAITVGGLYSNCEMSGNIAPITDSRLYSVNVVLSECSSSSKDGTYIGLATSRTDATTDDTLVFSAVEVGGLYSIDGDFK